jgi:hypothetical protein
MLSRDTALMAASVRDLGRMGLAVSRSGLGLAAVGRPADITLGRAADLGRNSSVHGCRRAPFSRLALPSPVRVNPRPLSVGSPSAN